MEFSVSINLNEDEKNQLTGIMKCEEDKLSEVLEPYAKAAFEEYIRMFLGQKVFTRGSDIREYRLFLLIKHAFENEIPIEQKICDLFQTTVTQSRSLIRSVMSKYQYDLEQAIETSLKKIIKESKSIEDNDDFLITIDNKSMVDELNRLLGSMDGTLPPVSKKRGTVTTYVLKPSSRTKLVEHFDLEVD